MLQTAGRRTSSRHTVVALAACSPAIRTAETTRKAKGPDIECVCSFGTAAHAEISGYSQNVAESKLEWNGMGDLGLFRPDRVRTERDRPGAK